MRVVSSLVVVLRGIRLTALPNFARISIKIPEQMTHNSTNIHTQMTCSSAIPNRHRIRSSATALLAITRIQRIILGK